MHTGEFASLSTYQARSTHDPNSEMAKRPETNHDPTAHTLSACTTPPFDRECGTRGRNKETGPCLYLGELPRPEPLEPMRIPTRWVLPLYSPFQFRPLRSLPPVGPAASIHQQTPGGDIAVAAAAAFRAGMQLHEHRASQASGRKLDANVVASTRAVAAAAVVTAAAVAAADAVSGHNRATTGDRPFSRSTVV